jgi:hypothetical protein
MTAASAQLALAAVVLCSSAAFWAGITWRRPGRAMKLGAVVLFLIGLFCFFCAAFTE